MRLSWDKYENGEYENGEYEMSGSYGVIHGWQPTLVADPFCSSTRKKLIRCGYCRSANKEDDSFCSQCGAPLWDVDESPNQKAIRYAQAVADANWNAIERIKNE